jgi:uncharacterized damage-inducible protein DinB
MTYYGSKDLAGAFRTVRNNTIQIAEEIPEEKYGFRPAEGCRSVAETLVHIAVTPRLPEQIHFIEGRSALAGFDFLSVLGGIQAEEKKPRSKAEILELLRSSEEHFAQKLEGASEEFLAQRVTMPPGMTPESKTRFEMLLSPKEHEMHHRGQLMTMQRLMGMKPHLTRQFEERVAAIQAQQAGQVAAR